MAEDYLKSELPKWLRSVELEEGGARLAAIETAAAKLGRILSGRDILDMTLLAHGQLHDGAFERLNDALREHDRTFGCRADDLESRIAAGATVAAVLGNDLTSTAVAAQGVLSAHWLGLSPAVADLPALAVRVSRERSEALRRRQPLPNGPASREFFKNVPEFESGNSVTSEDVGLLRAATKKFANEVQRRQYSFADVLATRLDAADEELEVLWWAFSDYSELAKARWAHVTSSEAALLCGIELGSKLAFDIELPSTEALLARLLGPNASEPVVLGAAVDAAAPYLRSMALQDGHQLLPILSSVSEHLALNGDSSWRGSVARWNINPDHSTDNLAFARQAVRERALLGNMSHD